MKAACAIAGLALGLFAGWLLWHASPVVEPPAPAIALPSGGLIAERLPPPETLPAVATEAAAATGGQVARVGHVVVEPGPSTGREPVYSASPGVEAQYSGAPGGTVDASSTPCICRPEPIRVDWSLVTDREGGYRMAVGSPDGTVIEASDRPIAMPPVARQYRWAAGASISVDNTGGRSYGAWADRDLGRVRLGFEVSQRDGGTASLRAGIRF